MRGPALPRPGSLTARLVATTLALVMAVAVLIAVVATLGVRGYLDDRLDDDVRAALERASRPGPGGTQPWDDGQPGPGPGDVDLDGDGDGDRRGPGDVRGQGVGTLTAFLFEDYEAGLGDVLVQEEDGGTARQQLSAAALDVLGDVPVDGEPHDVELPGLGSYRVIAVAEGGSSAVVAGLPTDDVDDVVGTLVAWEVVLVLLGGLVASVAGLLVVRRQLRPLREVAATARAVAALPLSSGEIDLTERVPDRLSDERTEVGQVGAALNALLTHVEDSLSARHRSEQQVRQFVADASHELRTPLATIAGYTELARRRPDRETTATALGKVEEEARRMTSLVEDLLLLARLDAGRPLAEDTVDLTRLLLEGVADARVLAPDHRWRLDLPADSVEVTGDEARLRQVVTNLLTNARKHTPAGTTVTVTATPDGFAVHDDGPGFPPSLLDHAFERFARGDTSRHREGGAGLGLSLVAAIVEAHGGEVGLASRPGDTTVTVRLPRR
ncbi:sensor histidine kinase [Nocardioides dongkuii]|uniref:sensor histidine kinase n=1 Tax=Nocardioides dongkuii TaxID=2760089 RepID=UPI001FD0D05F|nr:HAMP domain-containing sensor histidine kinase [Nocardioides dongkuii]